MKRIDTLLFYVGVIILFLLSACSRNMERQYVSDTFDLEGIIDAQVFFLSKNNIGVQKITSLGPKEDRVEHYPDSAGWAKELNIIKTANIDKPGLKPYYDLLTTDSSIYFIDSYVLNDTGRAITLYQKIYRHKKNNIIKRIKIRQQIINPIYHSGRAIEVVFKESEENMIIDSIIVNGYQKIIFLDTAYYQTISRTIR
jgi:hypothetical protein